MWPLECLKRFYYSHIWKNSPFPGGHVLQKTRTIFELIQDIIRTITINVSLRVLTNIIGKNFLTKFHDDRTINVAYRVFTRFFYSQSNKNASPPGGHVFKPTGTIFELIQYIIGTNLWPMLTRKNSPPHGGHVFQPTGTIFQLVQEIIGANLLTKVLARKNAPPRGGHVFQPTGTICELVKHIIKMNHLTKLYSHKGKTIFELIQYIIGTNLLTKFHDDRTKMFYYRHIKKNAPPPGCHDIITMNLWTKFHEDRTINVASKMLTRQMLTPHNARQTKCDHKSSP
ncbi:hypothetical protein DPMN_082746 [Dreissena polymorpha]|uniref:Uncharacterized protein n=1 Tax=Dreissena polymorpha TaxID=45954 RepID=A0A9D4BHR7_DREPO|nr:hypothetical protein DPMN_082746 [Dreissena polymorpha]